MGLLGGEVPVEDGFCVGGGDVLGGAEEVVGFLRGWVL